MANPSLKSVLFFQQLIFSYLLEGNEMYLIPFNRMLMTYIEGK